MGKEIVKDFNDSRASEVSSVKGGGVFRKCDWLAAGIVFVLALALYVFTLAPTVTLEDSGELVVAAEYLGVPHPPGYPLWTILAWMFTRIFFFVKYAGHPNPAWGVNFTSAFFGALSSAVVALLVSRTGHNLLSFRRSQLGKAGAKNLSTAELSSGHGFLTPVAEQWITAVSGIAAGLLFSFSPLQWSQAVIAEVYTINTFLTLLMFVFGFVWLQRPDESRMPYYIAFLFGLAITNFQPIVLIVPAMIIIFFFADRRLFKDIFALGLIALAGWVYIFRIRPIFEAGGQIADGSIWYVAIVLLLMFSVGIWFWAGKFMEERKRVLLMILLMCLGLCLFIYMPLASDTNPPMNWGYARTWEGFKHAVTRGQYQALQPAIQPVVFLRLAARYFMELEGEFTLPPLLIAFVLPVFFIKRLRGVDLAWIGVIFVGFIVYGIGMMAILNPGHDIQSMFIARVQLLQSLAICSLLIGCGFVLGLAFLEEVFKSKALLAATLTFAMAYPSVLLWKNAYDEELLKSYGAANLNNFDFGWQFGYFQLCGIDGIMKSLKPEELPPPNLEYPPPMTPDAIFFGGTDPGRFVPTYMIFSARVRPDVFLITQNALADNTYMSVMRDLYGDDIWIPTPQDSNIAFQTYVNDIRSGRVPSTASVNIDDSGKVSVQGVQGVMEINGIICRMMFDANKPKHDFYIEESYVIGWMYPYLEPHGLIMKINKEPLPALTEEMIKNDMEFWDWYSNRLLSDPAFLRSSVARKSFSKLRCAIGGLYGYRQLFNEAEAAFRQAIAISPISPEANFRLADLYMQQGRVKDAKAVMMRNLELDPRNEKVEGFLQQIKSIEQYNERVTELQNALANKAGSLDMVFELAGLYQQMGRYQHFYELLWQVVSNESVPPPALLKVAEMASSIAPQRLDFIAETLEAYLVREPGNPRIWLELACVRVALTQNEAALQALTEAVAVGGEPIRVMAAKDTRLVPLSKNEQFQKLVMSRKRRALNFPDVLIP